MLGTSDEVPPPPISVEPEPESDYSDEVEGKIKEFEKKMGKLTSIITKINNISDTLNKDNNKLNREIEDLKNGQRLRDLRLKHELKHLKDEIESDSSVLAISASRRQLASFERIEKLYNTVKILAAKADVHMDYDLRYTTRPTRASMKTSKNKKKKRKRKTKRKSK
jgi:septal ring factor EnvC (AmiA/AmiB activator)